MITPPEFNHQVRVVAEALAQENVTYLLIGKGAAIIHGFPDTTKQTGRLRPRRFKSSRDVSGAGRSAASKMQSSCESKPTAYER